jgi:ubiquinone/menaquinone biosynthesis C-methylase UbiE
VTETGVRRHYDRIAADYDRRWSGYVTASVRQTLARLPVSAGQTVLDVGCGTGALAQAMSRAAADVTVVGVDVTATMLRHAQAKLGHAVSIVAGDVAHLPFRSEAFDVVVSASSFHYWTDPSAGLAEVARVLRPGGRLVVTDWCDDYLVCRVCDLVLRVVDRVHRRTYGSADCARMLGAAGYTEVVVDRYRLKWVWGMMTALATVATTTRAVAAPTR